MSTDELTGAVDTTLRQLHEMSEKYNLSFNSVCLLFAALYINNNHDNYDELLQIAKLINPNNNENE